MLRLGTNPEQSANLSALSFPVTVPMFQHLSEELTEVEPDFKSREPDAEPLTRRVLLFIDGRDAHERERPDPRRPRAVAAAPLPLCRASCGEGSHRQCVMKGRWGCVQLYVT